MRGLLTGRTVLLAGSLYDVGELIALPLAAAGAAVVFAGQHDHKSRQLAANIHRAGGIVRSVEVEGSDFVTPAGPVDLIITSWPSSEAAGSTADGNTDVLTGRAVVEGRSEAIVEVAASPDGEARPARWTIERPETRPHASADSTFTRVHSVRVGAPATVAGEILRWSFGALLPSDATLSPTPPRSAEDILWDEEARADEDLNFELG